MRFNAAERESFRKRLEFFLVKIPNIKDSEIINHFEKEGIAQNTIYDNIKRLQTFSDKKRSGRPTFWSRENKAKLKRLVNNRKGFSQRKLDLKFGVNQSKIGCQF